MCVMMTTESCTNRPMFTHFQEGRELLTDDPCPGWPVSARSNENVEKTCAIVIQDRRITAVLLVDCLGIW